MTATFVGVPSAFGRRRGVVIDRTDARPNPGCGLPYPQDTCQPVAVWRGSPAATAGALWDGFRMPDHVMNYVEIDAPVGLTLVEWRRSRTAEPRRRRARLWRRG
jgi:hypothetical protein